MIDSEEPIQKVLSARSCKNNNAPVSWIAYAIRKYYPKCGSFLNRKLYTLLRRKTGTESWTLFCLPFLKASAVCQVTKCRLREKSGGGINSYLVRCSDTVSDISGLMRSIWCTVQWPEWVIFSAHKILLFSMLI